jgi:hypothetical protein
MRRFGVVAVAVLALPLATLAQRAGGVGGGGVARTGAVSAPVAAVRVSAPAGAHPVNHVAVATHIAPGGGHIRTSSPNRVVTLNPRFGNSNFVSNDVPGLGFDYPHLAAVSPKRGQFSRNHFRQTVPFGFGGFLLSTPEIVVENPQAVEDAQENAEQVDPDMQAQFEAAQMQAYRAGQRSAVQQAPPPPPAAEPAPDPASYVFVMRDGGVVFAVAYSWDNGTLRYVTPEGQRKSVAAESLDMEATQSFNESRGLSFHGA